MSNTPEPLPNKDDRPFDPLIFWVSASLTVLFILWSIIFPTNMETVVNAVFSWTTVNWGWLYLLTVFLLVLACVVLVVSNLGRLKLGRPDDKPEFSWYGVIGGAGIGFDVTQTLSEHGLESAIFAIIEHLPLTGLLAAAVIFLIATFFLTSANSAALALAMFVSGKETPGKNLRAFWGLGLGAVAAVLAGTGSLQVIQTASIAAAFPLMFLLLLVIYGTFKGLSQCQVGQDRE